LITKSRKENEKSNIWENFIGNNSFGLNYKRNKIQRI